MNGPSKYDDLARFICVSHHADAAIVLIVGGAMGSGAALAQTPVADSVEYLARCAGLAAALRSLADDIEGQQTEPVQGWRAVFRKP